MPRDKPKEWPRRPPRLGRLFDNVRPLYFITFNTYRRQCILARDEVHETFCIFSLRAQRYDVAVGRYVIMPDHVHLFVALPIDGVALPRWVQSLRNVIGKKLGQLGISKPHWQEGFFDHLLRSHESSVGVALLAARRRSAVATRRGNAIGPMLCRERRCRGGLSSAA